MGYRSRSGRIRLEWRKRGEISFDKKRNYVFGVFSNQSHEFGFGGDVVVVVVGDEEDIAVAVDCLVELCGLDEFVKSDFGGGLLV